MSLQKGITYPLGKNANEHTMGTVRWRRWRDSQTLLDVEKESPWRSGVREAVGVLVDRVKRNGR